MGVVYHAGESIALPLDSSDGVRCRIRSPLGKVHGRFWDQSWANRQIGHLLGHTDYPVAVRLERRRSAGD